MAGGLRAELGMLLAWLAFPIIPVVLEDLYYQYWGTRFLWSLTAFDPYDWTWGMWHIVLGPLLGYAFLAGATAEALDDASVSQGGWRRLLARRAVWVAIGPWWGFLLLLAGHFTRDAVNRRFPRAVGVLDSSPWFSTVSVWIWWVFILVVVPYCWCWPAWSALRRAGRIGRARRALTRGIVTATAFVGSLFGSFWAITRVFRAFFFDPRVMPVIAMAVCLVALSGCSSTVTYGEMRRRELFHAMLLSWTFGLAVIWWWVSRRRRGPRPPSGSDSGAAGSS